MVAIRHHHNSIVQRLTNAIRFGEVITDRCIENSNSNLRPDIVIQENNKVIIIDVCCPFDNDPEALTDAENCKLNKCEFLKHFFTSQGKYSEVYGFVVGALGSWYPRNEAILRALGMTRSYKSLFRKLCCTDAIKGSTDILRQHMGLDD